MTVLQLVERERALLRRAHVTTGAAVAAATLLAILAVGGLALGAARWLALPRVAPFAVWLAALAGLALAWRWTRRTVRREASTASVAGAIEREQGLRAGSVRGVVEVGDASPLGRFAAEAVARRLTPAAALAPSERRRASRRGRRAAAGAALALALLVLVGTVASDGLAAILRPVSAWRGTLLPPLTFADVPTRVLRGEQLEVRVRAPGRTHVRIERRAVGGAWVASGAAVDPRTEIARVSLGKVDADIRVVATDGRASTDTLAIEATDRPFVGDLALRAEYPAYLQRPSETLPAGERLRLPRGTRLLVSGRSSVALDALELVREGAPPVALRASGYQFAGGVVVDAPASWRFRATAASRAPVDVPSPLEVDMLVDSAPRADIRAPTADTTIGPGDAVRLAIEAADDHGLAGVAVRSWRVRPGAADAPAAVQRVPGVAEVAWSGEAVLPPVADLQPGDRVHVVVVATDRSPWRQTGQSRELVLRVPSLGEQREAVRRLADSTAAAAAAVATAQRQLAQRSGELSRTRPDRSAGSGTAGGSGQSRAGAPLGFEGAERARALAREQRELAAKVDAVREQARQVERQLKQAGALDSGLSARLQEAQRLLREALTPELAAKLAEMEQAAANESGDQARASMQELAEQQQRAREQLERGVEMLKRAALEGAMETLRDDAREVAQRERALSDSIASGRQTGDEAKELAARARELASDVRGVRDRLQRAGATAGPERMESAAEHANNSAAELRKAGDQRAQRPTESGARAGESTEQAGRQEGGAQEGGDAQEADAASRAAAEMEQAARDLAEAREAQVGQWKQELTRDLDQSIQETLQLAREERALAEQARQAQANGASEGEQAKQSAQSSEAREANEAGAQRAGEQRQGAPQTGQKSQSSEGQSAGRDQAARQPGSEQAGGEQAGRQDAGGQQGGREGRDGKESTEQQSGGDQTASPQDAAKGGAGAKPSGSSPGEQQGSGGGMSPGEVRERQSTLQQGTNRAAERLEQAGRKSALVSPRSQRAMADARRKVESATKETATGSQSAASSMEEAAEALNQAAAAMVRDRERANSAGSASGFPELLQRLQEAARQQGKINAQSAAGMPSGQGGAGQNGAALRGLARQQRSVAQSLEEAGADDASGRSDALAKEARDIAEALERGAADEATLARQQRLHRRLLDAGRSMEQEEREDNGRREAQAAAGGSAFSPDATTASGRAAARYKEPSWNELRGLTAEERRLVLEYFKRLNATP